VLPILKKSHGNLAVIAMAEALVVRARTGLVTGLMCIAAGADGSTQLGISGDFADDVEFATRAADSGFALLTNAPRAAMYRRPLPQGLRGKI
jgi:hypothetical protein